MDRSATWIEVMQPRRPATPTWFRSAADKPTAEQLSLTATPTAPTSRAHASRGSGTHALGADTSHRLTGLQWLSVGLDRATVVVGLGNHSQLRCECLLRELHE